MPAGPVSVGGVVLRTGTRLRVTDRNYKWGTGDVDLEVRAVLDIRSDDEGTWVELDVDELLARDTTRRRFIQIRVSALRTAVDPTPR
jgi:hypothetical protein